MCSRDYAARSDGHTPGELATVEAELTDEGERAAACAYWERVIELCHIEVANAPRPTSALLDGTAAERRRRRMERRALAAVECALPVREVGSASAERAA